MRKTFIFFFLYCIGMVWFHTAYAEDYSKPAGLTVNFLSYADQVFLNGYPVDIPLNEAVTRRENFQFTEIGQKLPFFGWVVNSDKNNTLQVAYQILVASTPESIKSGVGDMWDSGKQESDQSVNVVYNGRLLETGKVYFWKVKTWDNHGVESPYSDIRQFRTAAQLLDYSTARYPLQKQDDFPEEIISLSGNTTFIDFGKAGFGRLRLTLGGEKESDTVTIHLGEAQSKGRIDRNPGGTIRYSVYRLVIKKGWNNYTVMITPDKRNTGPQAVLLPEYTGEVTPFRYCEIENYPGKLTREQVVRETVFYPFKEEESEFSCSDTVLNRVWEMCKYSIKATSFLGIYVDGDRERIPYEADALINQLGHYGVAREYSMARYSHEYLINKPTWPTEWIMQSVLMAWNDYVYTGNMESLGHFYTDLKAKTLLALEGEDGLISTKTGKVTPDVLGSIHFKGNLRDIVDWPQKGILGLGKNEEGETDGFVFQDVNTVVNAYHYRSLVLMGKMAAVSGNTTDKAFYEGQAEKVKKAFNEKLLDRKQGIYVDGIGTGHASLHGNMFPLAFGLVPEKNIQKVTDFIRSRGMACSVYGSQFLLDAVYDTNDAEYGLQLLASTAERSWYNMIREGSTISMEAWDNKYKPNQDWNHAWGAAPANLIPRKLMGIEPLEPGPDGDRGSQIRVKPQPGTLESAQIKVPTIHGAVEMSFQNKPGSSFTMHLRTPANTMTEVYLPFWSKKQKVLLNGEPVSYMLIGGFAVIDGIGSGENRFEVKI
jgi:alpha-L-rhamnosidase